MQIEEYCKVFVQKFYEKGFKIELKGKDAVGLDNIYIDDIEYPFVNNYLRIEISPKLPPKNSTYFRTIAWVDTHEVFKANKVKILTDRWYELQKICEEINKLIIKKEDIISGKFKSNIGYVSKTIYK